MCERRPDQPYNVLFLYTGANLPAKSLDRMSLKKEIDQIGKVTDTGKTPA
jgi:hypothetical protein